MPVIRISAGPNNADNMPPAPNISQNNGAIVRFGNGESFGRLMTTLPR